MLKMEKKLKIVIALGGNAILTDDAHAKAQQQAIQGTVKKIITLIKAGHQIILSHGNGPQVGNLLLQQLAADSTDNPALPLDTLVAMTQGSIGYWLVQALEENLAEHQIKREVAALITQVVIAEDDPALRMPTKPIGPFYSEEAAQEEMANQRGIYQEDSGRGWRKVVPSPVPHDIKGSQVIKKLIENQVIVVAGGGGGIPVIRKGSGMIGVEAVIDKDLASQKLAELIDADQLIILTGVDNVYINYNQINQKKLTKVTVSELKQYIQEDQFAKGSMLPKIEAAIAFVESQEGRQTIITSLDQLGNIQLGAGTLITN